MLLNNLCEWFDSVTLEARTKGIIRMNEIIRTRPISEYKIKRDAMATCEVFHCPKILKNLLKVKALSWFYRTWSGVINIK